MTLKFFFWRTRDGRRLYLKWLRLPLSGMPVIELCFSGLVMLPGQTTGVAVHGEIPLSAWDRAHDPCPGQWRLPDDQCGDPLPKDYDTRIGPASAEEKK
jgi:hypothetical protein